MTRFKQWILIKLSETQSRADEGQGLAEYGLILALIAVVCIVALEALAGGINGTLGSITAKL